MMMAGRQASKWRQQTTQKKKKAKTTTKWWWKEKSRIPSIPMLLWETHTYFFLLLPYNGINDNSFVLFCLSYILVVHVLVRFIFVQWSVFLSFSLSFFVLDQAFFSRLMMIPANWIDIVCTQWMNKCFFLYYSLVHFLFFFSWLAKKKKFFFIVI